MKKILILLMISFVFISACEIEVPKPEVKELPRFESDQSLLDAFEEAKSQGSGGILRSFASGGLQVMEASGAAPTADAGAEYSETNIQVEGVDEADIIKTDGDYIYAIANDKLIIAKAYPEEDAEILFEKSVENFSPNEIFINDDRLLVFGRTYYDYQVQIDGPVVGNLIVPPYNINSLTVKLYDINDKENPELLKNYDFEGNYLTSRKIGDNVYFVVNSWPRYYLENPECGDIVPLYRESDKEEAKAEEFKPIASCIDIGYIPPMQASGFITVASISMEDEIVQKEVIVGSGQEAYASLDNLYIVQTSWPRYGVLGEIASDSKEETVITKFNLDNGEIKFEGVGSVEGHILNQFSMDEYNNHFRIATTKGSLWGRAEDVSTNNVYALDEDLNLVGALEDLAPGEKIYSVRFMGDRGYVVTFKKVDPLFVIDLEDPSNPNVLGKLKIPGYSDYLHPYDEDHIIGVGKDAIDAGEDLVNQRQLDFAWYQGVKMALFDVSDVENPIEMYKVLIGDRGTDSDVLYDHKAFLFDKERNLLVLPITLAEIKGEKTSDNQYGEFTFQGAYVYDLTLEDGFELRGRITHYDDNEAFEKSGFYFRGNAAIRRSLYIGDILYTFSNARLQLNDLDSLDGLKTLDFEESGQGYPVYY